MHESVCVSFYFLVIWRFKNDCRGLLIASIQQNDSDYFVLHHLNAFVEKLNVFQSYIPFL